MKTPKDIAFNAAKREIIHTLNEERKSRGVEPRSSMHNEILASTLDREKWRFEREHPEFDLPGETPWKDAYIEHTNLPKEMP